MELDVAALEMLPGEPEGLAIPECPVTCLKNLTCMVTSA